MNNEVLGAISCPVCGADAPLKETKKKKAYITCDGCGCQIFARGVVSDASLRGRVKGRAETAQDAKPAAQETPPGVTVRRHSSNGHTQTTERTIFDMAADFMKG